MVRAEGRDGRVQGAIFTSDQQMDREGANGLFLRQPDSGALGGCSGVGGRTPKAVRQKSNRYGERQGRSETNTRRKTQRKWDKKTEAEAEPERDREKAPGSKAGHRGLVGPVEGQAWMGGGDGWRAHQFLKAKARRAAESVKFTLLISCNNL